MLKSEAVGIFGTGTALADALDITKSAISQWSDLLTQKQTDWVVGAAIREGKHLPDRFIRAEAAA